MKIHLYKVWRIDDTNNDDPCDRVIVMTEKDLRKEFMITYIEGGIPQELLNDFKQDEDYKTENWDDIENIKIGTMIDMLNEICDYIPGIGYYILETDIEI